MNQDELTRLAAMANALRPDWPAQSVRTYLDTTHAHRAYRDIAVALAWIAADPTTQTPKRLEHPGPWWTTTRDETPHPPVPPVTRLDLGTPQPAHVAERGAMQVRAAMAKTKDRNQLTTAEARRGDAP